MSSLVHAAKVSDRPLNRKWWPTLGKAAILFVIVIVVSAIPIVRDSEVRLTDRFFRLAPPPRQPSQVVLVLIDEESLQKYGRWPWPRTLLADLNTNIAQAGASAIGFDILLSEPQSAEADHAVAESFRASGRTIVVDKIGTFPDGSRWIGPMAEFAESARVGHAQAVLDADGVCRRFPPRELTLDGPQWAFALEVARRAGPEQASKFFAAYGLPESGVVVGVDLAAPALVRIPFRRDGFEKISARAVLDRSGLDSLRERPVLVGFGPTEIGDRLATPLSRELPTLGVEIHAQILDSVLTGRMLRDVPLGWSASALFLSCVLSITISQRWHGWQGLAWLGIFAVGINGVAFLLYLVAARMLPAGTLVLAVIFGPMLVYGSDFVHVERAVTRQLFGLRSWLQLREQDSNVTKHDLSWKLQLLQDLQTELGALYELHQTLLESTQHLIAIFDERGRPLLKNHLFSAVCPPKIKDLTLDQFRACLSPKADAALVGNGPNLEGEVYLGTELYSLRQVPLPPTFLCPKGGTILSMTSLRTREERDRGRAEALGFITHELRTPLTSIQGFAELMTRYPGSPSCAAAPETIARESKRLLAMINGYLNVLRLDAGAKPLQASSIEVEELVKQVFDVLQPLAAGNEMRLMLCRGPESVLAVGDAPLITCAILNLVSNAIKYGKLGTDIVVRCRAQDNETVISVENQGDAIPVEDISRIFDPYYRALNTEDTAQGWGLGLAFVKRIAEKHGGSVTVESYPTRTRFEIHLPATAAMAVTSEVTT